MDKEFENEEKECFEDISWLNEKPVTCAVCKKKFSFVRYNKSDYVYKINDGKSVKYMCGYKCYRVMEKQREEKRRLKEEAYEKKHRGKPYFTHAGFDED